MKQNAMYSPKRRDFNAKDGIAKVAHVHRTKTRCA